jgi:ribosomal protein L7/L12
VVELWNGGKRLKAIRAYREATGVELKEARSRLERGFPSPMVQLERNVDQLLLHYRLPVESPLMMLPAVRAELERGRKIHAIKAYRAATGADLREAKDAVDEFERHLKK